MTSANAVPSDSDEPGSGGREEPVLPSDDWWAGRYGLARPPETFHRDRDHRDVMRRRSQWEVRVAQLRDVPPPPTVEQWLRRHPDHRRPGHGTH
jgi:hypothetical protein